jgi:uncharacterized protein (TIGR03083 family)
VREEPDHQLLTSLTEQDRHALKLLGDQMAEHWSLDSLTGLLYGIPKLIRGLPIDAPPAAELKVAQRAWFVLLYRLLTGKDTGPRLRPCCSPSGRKGANSARRLALPRTTGTCRLPGQCGSSLRGMGPNLDYLAHLAQESARFLEVIAEAPPDARVPSCPDWSADDLLWHLSEVQWFWGTIVRDGLTGEKAEQRKPKRPGGRAALLSFYRRASHDLSEVLAAVPAPTPAWTWSEDHTVGFIRRRQAHEALIHRVDAELAADDRSPVDPRLGADGADEALRIMYGGDAPVWGTFTANSDTALRLHATDTGDSWLVTLGRFTGTGPGDQTSYDEPGIQVTRDPGTGIAASISGNAADLNCWLWRRPSLMPLERSGDPELLGAFDALIAPGIS